MTIRRRILLFSGIGIWWFWLAFLWDGIDIGRTVDNYPTTAPAEAGGTTVTVQVTGTERYQTIDGFGAALTPFEWRGIYYAHQQTQPITTTATLTDRQGIAQLLYGQLGLTHMRLFINGWEPGNDNTDPSSFNSAGFDWTMLDWQANYVSLSRPYGLQTWWFTGVINPRPWPEQQADFDREAWLRLPGSPCRLDPAKVDEEVEWLLAAALHFRDLGLELPYLSVNNEPEGPGCTDSGGHPARVIEVQDLVTIVKRLGARLQAHGLATKIILNDGWYPQLAINYMQAVLADPDARQYVGVLAYHAYADGYDDPSVLLSQSAQGMPPAAAVQVRQQILQLATQYNLPVWMSEVCYCTHRDYSDFDLVRARLNHIHDELTIGNISAFDAMNLFFIDRPGVRDELVHIYFQPDGKLDRYEISTYGYMLGHYARYIPPGSVRLGVSSSDPRVRVTAFERPDGGLAVVALNNHASAIRVNLSFNNLSRTPAALTVLTSEQGAVWLNQPDISITGNSAMVTLPPLSATTLSNACYDFRQPAGVDMADLQEIVQHWSSADPSDLLRFDLNRNQRIDVVDISRVAAQLGRSCP